MTEATLKATKREAAGRQAVKALRRSGKLPAVIYGRRHEPMSVFLDYREFEAFIRKYHGENIVINLDIEGMETKKTLLKDVQRDYIRDRFVHVDFLQFSATDRISTTVPVLLTGRAIGARPEHGGILEQVLRELDIRCAASNIPQHLEVDISGLHLHESMHVRDLSFPGIDITTHDDAVVASVVASMTEASETEEEGPAEPEIIGRARRDKEDGD
jgi:large subunit ribosomal protein L25